MSATSNIAIPMKIFGTPAIFCGISRATRTGTRLIEKSQRLLANLGLNLQIFRYTRHILE
jgi:hypothetical protein